MNLSKQIQFYRKQKGISQEQCADLLHVSRQAVSKWEQGVAIPTLENCLELCKIFSISMNELTESPNTPQLQEKETPIVKDKRRIIPILWILLIVACIVVGALFFYIGQLKTTIRQLENTIVALRSPSYIITPPNDTPSNLLTYNIDFQDVDIENDQVTMLIQVQLKQSQENTKVMLHLQSMDEQWELEAVRQSDYSYLGKIQIPLVEAIKVTASQVDDGEIQSLFIEDSVVKARFIKTMEIALTNPDELKNAQSLVKAKLEIGLKNEYGSYGKLDMVTMLVQVKQNNQGIASYRDSYDFTFKEDFDQAQPLSITLNAYPEFNPDNENIEITVTLYINDTDTVTKTVKLSDLLS